LLTENIQDAIYEELGKLIRAARDKANVKQETLADYLNLSRVSISNIEAGKQKIQLHTLLDVTKYLSMDIQEILMQLQPLLIDKISPSQERKIESYLGNPKDPDKEIKDKENIAGFMNFSKSKNS
jgi:transcriptional regulator with XRE-family HTH domain